MSNDGTGLRECLHNAVALFGGQCTDPSQLAWLEQSRDALSAVAPPPVLEGMEDAVAAVAGAIWFAAGDEGYLMGSGPFLNAHPDDQAAMKRIASAAIKESLTVAMLAASPAAPAQPEGGEAVGAIDQDGRPYLTTHNTNLPHGTKLYTMPLTRPQG